MSWLQAILLGLLQGATEFLPVSSTAHLRVVPALLGWSDPGAAFTAVTQLGTLFAVVLYFRRDLWTILRALATAPRSREARMGWAIGAGTVPILAAGWLAKPLIVGPARSLWVVAGALVLLALALWLAEALARHERGMDTLSFRDAQLVGLAQALALVPGVSRSGVTLTAGLALGLKRDDAARFSFLLSVPAVTAAGVYELTELLEAGVPRGEWEALTVATLVAGLSGYAAIALLLRWLRTRSALPFVAYRIALGGILLGLLAAGRI